MNTEMTSVPHNSQPKTKEISDIYKEINSKADFVMQFFIYGFFAFGVLISPIYETYAIALTIGGACIALYLVLKFSMPNSALLRYTTSALFCVQAAQFIYQMHGLFEMHFFFFIIVNMMIIHRDWKVFIPITAMVVLHHTYFSYLQNSGYTNVFFSQLENIDMQSLVFHYLLFVIHVLICAWWSIILRNQYIKEHLTIIDLKSEVINNDKNAAFADQISQGNLEATFDLSEGNHLGKALVSMRENLKMIAKQDSDRNWTTEGIAKIGEILRANNANLSVLADRVLNEIIKYLDANQGAFYIVNNTEKDDQHIELKACYAYNRKKYISKRIELGEGLVGQAALEKDVIYLEEIPRDFVKITSGLGEASPTSLLIVPFLVNEEVQGLIEICSFRKIAPHEKEFIKKVSESIGSSIATVKINEHTQKLLQESQGMTEILRNQEEEMRQNLEEMQSTQEEMKRLTMEMEGQLSAIDSTLATIEFDLQGTILSANENFLKLMKYSLKEIEGKHHRIFVAPQERNSEAYIEFWKGLGSGKSTEGEFLRIDKNGKEIYIKGIYNPIYDSKGQPVKIFKLCHDITEQQLLRKQVMSLNKDKTKRAD